jgi:hypothetical protein
MMFSNLYSWFLFNKELALPGIGVFILNRQPAQIDFPNKKILPPVFHISLERDNYTPGPDFFNWLASSLELSQRDAIFRFNEFTVDLNKNISEGTVVNWNGLGILRKGMTGDVEFTPWVSDEIPGSITAEKIIREKAQHRVLVGEEEKSSEEMSEILGHTEEKKSYWWVYALTIGVLGLMFTGWWLSENGFSIANTEKFIPADPAGVGYNILQ